MLSPVNLPLLKGYLPSPHDSRDKLFEDARGSFYDLGSGNAETDEYLIPRFVPVTNQSALGSCVAWTFTDISEILMGLEMQKNGTLENGVPKLSAMFLYFLCRAAMGTVDRDTGTYLRLAAKQLRNVGICLEKTWPYDISRFRADPGFENRSIASDNRLEGFYALTSTGSQRLDDIDAALNANHPVAFGTTVGTDFRNPPPDAVLDVPSDSLGGHAMAMVGRRRRANGRREYLWLNHWSDQWANNGTVWVTEEYVTSRVTNDLWVGTRIQELVL